MMTSYKTSSNLLKNFSKFDDAFALKAKYAGLRYMCPPELISRKRYI
ncbi:hypothetical protein KSX_78210 [Ktedonospora formicarum]|uniref:Uncharacterized protein n=1 Tax=Ktedonospora formicarum TaxID=2778364 RepID=A0A8J3I9G1_9CHLR|nr:hypothetical protein KSX_78210 [Ktedonospora formicarum]